MYLLGLDALARPRSPVPWRVVLLLGTLKIALGLSVLA